MAGGHRYQGWVVQSFRLERSRGYSSDSSWVVMPVGEVPALTPPALGGLSEDLARRAGAAGAPSAGPTVTRWSEQDGGADALPNPGALRAVGALEIDQDPPLRVEGLLVVAVSTERMSASGSPVLVRVVLADARHLWTRGFCRRWSYNRTRGDGSRAGDALKPDGSPWTRREIALDVAAGLPGAPVVHVPASWDAVTGPIEFAPFCAAVVALRKLAGDGGALEPCLRLDGSVELARKGGGMVGVAPAPGEPNALPVPPELVLYRQGTGRGIVREHGYTPDFVLVRGRERIATVSLDDWEPVLVIESAPGVARSVLPLTEETVRELTEGRYGLAALAYLVTAPEALGVPEGVRPEVARLLRSQAWRLWRMPGAVGKEPGEVGPNAHLLPMLPRAEVSAGRRLPVTVEVYRYETIHRSLGSDNLAQATAIEAELRKVRGKVQRFAASKGLPDPFGTYRSAVTISKGLSVDAAAEGVLQLAGSSAARPAEAELRADRLAGASLGDLTAAGLPSESIQQALDSLRLQRRIGEVDSGLAAEYGKLRDQQRKIADEANGTTRYESAARVARILLEFEDSLRRQAEGSFGTALGSSTLEQARVRRENQGLRDRLKQQLADELEALRRQEESTRVRRNAGLPPGQPKERTATFVRNVERREADDGARVYSHELGIVQTSALAGWLAQSNVPSAEATYFVPKPVRVLFGATRRPRTDARQEFSGTRVRGQAGDLGPGLGDALTWFHRAYRRGAPGSPVRVAVEDLPPGEAVVIPRDDLGPELIPLVGAGNEGLLELEARAIADAIFREPSDVAGETLIVAGAHLVQCDGVVQSVTIETRSSPVPGTGVTTTIRTGVLSGAPDPTVTRTRPPPPRGLGDGAKREGL